MLCWAIYEKAGIAMRKNVCEKSFEKADSASGMKRLQQKMLLRQFMHRAGRIRQNPVAEKAECLIWEKCTYQIGRKYDIIKHTE